MSSLQNDFVVKPISSIPDLSGQPQANDKVLIDRNGTAYRTTIADVGGLLGLQAFTNASSITVTHNRNKTMDVYILDLNNRQIVGEIVQAANANSFTVSFNVPLSGTIYYK